MGYPITRQTRVESIGGHHIKISTEKWLFSIGIYNINRPEAGYGRGGMQMYTFFNILIYVVFIFTYTFFFPVCDTVFVTK